MKFNFPLNNFTQGEWGPKFRSRSDSEEYLKACETMQNFLPQVEGGAQFRGGFRRLDLANADQTTLSGYTASNLKLVPYLSPSDPAFNAELLLRSGASSLHYIQRFSDSNVTMTSKSITPMSSLGFPNNSSATLPQQNMHHVQMGDRVIFADPSGTISPFMFYYNAVDYYTASVGYHAEQLMVAKYLSPYQSFKYWTAIPWTKPVALGSGPTMTLSSAATGSRTLTASGSFFFSPGGAGLEWIGVYFRFCSGTDKEAIAYITGWTSETVVQVQVIQITSATTAYGGSAAPTTFWQCHAWNNYFGWPKSVTAYQGRVIFGGNKAQPDTIWGSRINNIFDMEEIPSPDTTGALGYANDAYLADNTRAFGLTPSFDTSAIRSLSAGKTLTILTDKSEIVAYGTDGALGPLNIQFESSTAFGATTTVPARVNNYLTYVQKSGHRLRDIIFSFDEAQYKSANLSLQAEHFFTTSDVAGGFDNIKELHRYENDQSLLFVVTELGKLFVAALDRDFGVNAWARLPTAENMSVNTLCVGADGEISAIVTRDSGNFLCRMTNPFQWDNPFNGSPVLTKRPVFLDFSAVAEAGAATPTNSWNARTSASFTNRYSGKTVSVVADGNYVGEVAVASDAAGTFTLPNGMTASHVLIGYKYEGILKTMPLQQGGQWGQPVGRHKRVDEMVISLLSTVGIKYGKSEDDLYEIPFREQSQVMDSSIEYFTGDKVVEFPPGYERDLQVVIKQDNPYPCYIRSVTPRGVTYD